MRIAEATYVRTYVCIQSRTISFP